MRDAWNWRYHTYGGNLTPMQRATHLNKWEVARGSFRKHMDNWNGKGPRPQKPCGPPPGGPFSGITMLVGEYLIGLSLDEAAATLPPQMPKPKHNIWPLRFRTCPMFGGMVTRWIHGNWFQFRVVARSR